MMANSSQNLLTLQIPSILFWFTSVTQSAQAKIKFSSKPIEDFLPPNNFESFATVTIGEEISKIISSHNNYNSTGPNY